MISRIIEMGTSEDPLSESADTLVQEVSSPRQDGRAIVARAEAQVLANPASSFEIGADGFVRLVTSSGVQHAGRFTTPSLSELKAKAAGQGTAALGGSGHCRLFAIRGDSALTDIGALQAFDDGQTLFQVASQFNCLEAPGPHVVPVRGYFDDPTQGPRASISAFPGTLLRHYGAPDGAGGRFTQSTEGAQIDLLREAVPGGLARVNQGYLRATDIRFPDRLAEALAAQRSRIRVGVHEQVEVVLGHGWNGPIKSPAPRVNQVFTSTLAAGMYSAGLRLEADNAWRSIARHLLSAAYEGTLLAAQVLGCRRVVLTLIGGGVFGNPHDLIADAIDRAIGTLETHGGRLDVVINLYRNATRPFEALLGRRQGVLIDVGARSVDRRPPV